MRSASTGRDKRSEFQARYWAFLFGNLQRAVDEIYKTVEYYEHLASCQEAILVLENYIREFKALAEFFQMSWDFEKTPLPQRPQSVAWEVRKTNTAPRTRNKNITSPSMSGKSSPSSFSGSNSPCPTIEENKLLTKSLKPKSPENRHKLDRPTIEISESSEQAANERKFEQLLKDSQPLEIDLHLLQKPKSVSLENLNQNLDTPPDQYQFLYHVQFSDSETQTEGIHDDNLTLLEYITKYCTPKEITAKAQPSTLKSQDEKKDDQPEQVTTSLSLTPSLSDVLKPAANASQKPQPPVEVATAKTTSHAPVRANYSLRNQTITNKNSRVSVESTARKSQAVPHTVSRVSRPPPRTSASGNNIPSTNPKTVLIRDNAQKYQANLAIRSKTMIEFPKGRSQRIPLRSGELHKKKSLEDSLNSSTSTLKASTERLGSKNSLNRGSGDIKKAVTALKKIENKTVNQGSGDGWTTVKNKRRSSWSSQRFDQPSASASLPTLLALLNENGEESDKETSKESTKATNETAKKVPVKAGVKGAEQKKDLLKTKPVAAKLPVQKAKSVVSSLASSKKLASSVKAKVNSNAPSKRVTVNEKPKEQLAPKQSQQNQNFIKRQKSDITGLKIKSLHKEYLRSEKFAPKKKKENDEDNKVDMNLQTSTLLISQTIDSLYTDLSKESKFANGNLSSCDELEDDIESDDDHQKKLVEEQESLERQIRELENSEIDVDTETDETDCEAILCDLEDNESSENNDPEGHKSQSSFLDEDMTLEMRYAPMLADLSQMERAETLATLQELVARDPGRAQKLHQKLSSPSRRRSFHETLRKYQAKQSRAQEKRSELQQLKSLKIQQLIQRVEQVKAAKFHLTESRRIRMEEKLQRAAENRENFLKNKIKKAHDEEEKLKEIAFIKNIEMQNKRLDMIESHKEQEGRLQDLEQERQKRQTEKSAKEAEVLRRRQEIEMERIKKLEKMDETR